MPKIKPDVKVMGKIKDLDLTQLEQSPDVDEDNDFEPNAVVDKKQKEDLDEASFHLILQEPATNEPTKKVERMSDYQLEEYLLTLVEAKNESLLRHML